MASKATAQRSMIRNSSNGPRPAVSYAIDFPASLVAECLLDPWVSRSRVSLSPEISRTRVSIWLSVFLNSVEWTRLIRPKWGRFTIDEGDSPSTDPGSVYRSGIRASDRDSVWPCNPGRRHSSRADSSRAAALARRPDCPHPLAMPIRSVVGMSPGHGSTGRDPGRDIDGAPHPRCDPFP